MTDSDDTDSLVWSRMCWASLGVVAGCVYSTIDTPAWVVGVPMGVIIALWRS